MQFLVYSELPASMEIADTLKDIFKGTVISVVPTNSLDIKNGILRERNTTGLCLPGINGEKSGYTDQIGPSGLIEIAQSIREWRLLLTVCASTFFISRLTIYNAQRTNEILSRILTAPLFNAEARGPIPELVNKEELTLAPVTYKAADGSWKTGSIPYSNGPALYPDDLNDPNLEVLARYNRAADNPIAAASLAFGHGQILMLGILPYVRWQDVERIDTGKSLTELVSNLRKNAPASHEFLDSLAIRIRAQALTYTQKLSI